MMSSEEAKGMVAKLRCFWLPIVLVVLLGYLRVGYQVSAASRLIPRTLKKQTTVRLCVCWGTVASFSAKCSVGNSKDRPFYNSGHSQWVLR